MAFYQSRGATLGAILDHGDINQSPILATGDVVTCGNFRCYKTTVEGAVKNLVIAKGLKGLVGGERL